MNRRLGFAVFLLLVTLAAACASQPDQELANSQPFGSTPSASSSTSATGPVQYAVPDGWVEEDPRSSMRKGQFRLPRAEGDSEDAELVVFNFGRGQGGSVDANIARWIGQFSKPGGGPADESARTWTEDVNGQSITLLDVSGIYKPAAMGPMAPASPPKPDFRMMAAILDTPSSPWFFRLTGPQRTIEKWESSFQEFVQSIRVN